MTTTSRVVSKSVWTALMLLIGFATVLPFVWMLLTSLKAPMEVFSDSWLPAVPRWSNYREVWFGRYPFAMYYLNSIQVTFLCVIGSLLTSALAAYGFTKVEWRWRDPLFLVYLATMMIPPQVTLIPRFALFSWMGLYDSHWALILPGVTTVTGVFLMRQFFTTVPKELSEAAVVDGAGHLQIWSRIMLPLSKAPLAALGIMSFTWHWNDYENPLIMLTSKALFTVPLGMTNFIEETGMQYTLMMAAAVSAILPLLAAFLAGQRYFVEGLMNSGIKG